MSALFTEGQVVLAPLCRAVDALYEGSPVDVDGLLLAWRRLAPRCHPQAAADVVDVDAVVDVLRRRPDALIAPLVPIDADPRGSPVRLQMARCLADACILGLERAKLRHGLTASSSSLQAAFASPTAARDTLQALSEHPGATILKVAPHACTTTSWAEGLHARLPQGKQAAQLHMVAGVGARRLFDLISPYARRLRVELALLGRVAGVVDDDDVYRGLQCLNEREPRCVLERRSHSQEPADDGAVFVIDFARVTEGQVDRRVRALVAPLQKANVVIVGVVDVALLGGPLPGPLSSLQLLSSTTASQGFQPRLLLAGASGCVLPSNGSDSPSVSVPWRGLLPAGVEGDEDAFFGSNLLWRAQVDDVNVPAPVVRLLADGQHSVAALNALAAMVPAKRSLP